MQRACPLQWASLPACSSRTPSSTCSGLARCLNFSLHVSSLLLRTVVDKGKTDCGVPLGQVTQYLGYSSLKDFFPSMEIKPNTGCSNPLCCQRQASYQALFDSPAAVAERAAAQQAAEAAAAQEAAVLHETNEWGIEVTDDVGPGPSGTEAPAAQQQQQHQQQGQLAEGLEYSFPVRLSLKSVPACGPPSAHRFMVVTLNSWYACVHAQLASSNGAVGAPKEDQTSAEDVGDLMSQLHALSAS